MHTPGPWKRMLTQGNQPGLIVLGPDGRIVASVASDQRPECLDNAQAIEALPELLEALKSTTQVLAVQYGTRQRNGGAGQQAYEKARAAIAKATGD